MKYYREIAALAIPAIVSNITTPLLGLVDVAITGHLGESDYIAAIALGGAVFNMLYWLFGFLRMGTGGLTAQSYGAGQRENADHILYRSLMIGVCVGFLLIALTPIVAPAVMNFMDAEDGARFHAITYVMICVWGAPAVLCTYAMAGWFVGMQDTRSAMWMSLVVNVVNILVSATLVYVFGLKIGGVALGTLVAQWAGAAYGMFKIKRKYGFGSIDTPQLFDVDALKSFFKINTDIFLRTLCLVAVTLWFTRAGAQQGTDVLAANAVLLQLFMLFSYFMDGFAHAGEALAGKYDGAREYHHLRMLGRRLWRIGLCCATVFATLYFLAGEAILNILTSQTQVVAIAREYLPWAVMIPLWGFTAFVYDGLFIGIVATRAMLVSLVASMGVFFVMFFALHHSMGNDALWLAFNSYLLMRGIILGIIWKREIRGKFRG